MIVALEKFLAEAGWVERFEDEARLIGGRLVSKVQELKLEGEDEITAQASVLGEKVEATFWPQGGQMLFETSCSCEAGAFCEHGFALIGKMAKTKHLEKCVGLTAKQAVAVELARERMLLLSWWCGKMWWIRRRSCCCNRWDRKNRSNGFLQRLL